MSGAGSNSRIGQRGPVDTGRVSRDADSFTLDRKAQAAAPASKSAPVAPASALSLEGLGQKLGDMRRAIGMTQIDVAFRMSTTQPALARLEKGEAKPNLRTLSRYAAAIGQKVSVTFVQSNQLGRTGDTVAVKGRAQDLEQIPSVLAGLRKQLGITQSDVASRMETTQPVIARLESGGDGLPNLRTLERYSQAIGVDMAVKFEAEGAPRGGTGPSNGKGA